MKLKYHEKKLLRKVNFLDWKSDNTLREALVLRRYHVSDREDYVKYNRLVGMVTSLVAKLKVKQIDDPQRIEITARLLQKLYELGLLNTDASLASAERLTVSTFCRRRLPVVMVRLKMAESVKEAVSLIETGNVRVGPDTIRDPAYLVTRSLEDYISWSAHSKIRRHIATYNNAVDDFDLAQL